MTERSEMAALLRSNTRLTGFQRIAIADTLDAHSRIYEETVTHIETVLDNSGVSRGGLWPARLQILAGGYINCQEARNELIAAQEKNGKMLYALHEKEAQLDAMVTSLQRCEGELAVGRSERAAALTEAAELSMRVDRLGPERDALWERLHQIRLALAPLGVDPGVETHYTIRGLVVELAVYRLKAKQAEAVEEPDMMGAVASLAMARDLLNRVGPIHPSSPLQPIYAAVCCLCAALEAVAP